MPNVEFNIGNKTYNINCDAGEEAHIGELAKSVDVRFNAITKTFGSASDSLIMAITALMMEDEIKNLKENGSNNKNTSSKSSEEQAQEINRTIINTLEPITKYIENLAKKVENS